MIRWAYLIPRFVIIALMVLAVWVGTDPLIRYVVVGKLENSIAQKVEIGHVRCSLANQKIFLKDVAIADPRSPMKNLLQADMAYIELNPQSLLRRRVVIEHGQTSQVVFGAPRTESGSLEGFPVPGARTKSSWERKQFVPIEKIGLNWVDQLQPNQSVELSVEDLELVQAKRQLEPFWRDELAKQKSAIVVLQEKTAKLKTMANDYLENPLRPKVVNAGAEVESHASQTQAIQTRLFELQRLAKSNRDSLQLAHGRDVEKLRQSVQVTSFDSESISRLLLTESQEDRVAEIVGWLEWFRSAMPDPGTDFQPKHQRGVDVQLPGIEPKPGFLIKSLDLEGEGRVANRHINFAGSAYDLTSEPAIHDQPASFELRAQGDKHLIVTCTLDRRGETPIDTLNIICPDTELPAQILGEPKSLMVTMGPASRIQADIHIQVIGDQLSGDLVFRHSNVSLHVDEIHELAGGESTAIHMNQGLSSVDRFETRVSLSGTTQDYQYQFQSDLGSRFANAVNTLLVATGEKTIATRKRELDHLLNLQIKRLDDEILPQLQDLGLLLDAEVVEFASLRDAIPNPSNRLPEIR